MTTLPTLSGWRPPRMDHAEQIRTYSTTGDILSYLRCRRQYGFFGVRGFAASSNTQRYFGTLVHDVIDRISRDYRRQPVLPDETRIAELVEEAHDRLYRSGVRALNASQNKKQAITMISRLIQLIGAVFFPHVRETEYRLERALETTRGCRYVLDGIVDVLSGAVMHALEIPADTEPDDVEIWDYKSGRFPRLKPGSPGQHPFLTDYVYQMRVYAELYRLQTGRPPARCVLVFTGELLNDALWNGGDCHHRDFRDLFFVVTPQEHKLDQAMERFHAVVDDIEHERTRPYASQWHAPTPGSVDGETCIACDLRFNCSGYPEGRRLLRSAL